MGPASAVRAQEPPPASYDEVQASFASFVDQADELGMEVLAMFRADELDELHARFDDVLSAAVSAEQLAEGKAQVEATAELGEIVRRRAGRLSPDRVVYSAELEWGEDTLVFSAGFNADEEIIGIFLSPIEPLPAPPDRASQVEYRLPYDGLWLTFWGGETDLENYHVRTPVQRFAYDFLVWKDGASHSGDGTELTDYYAYGQEALAPASGTVTSVVDGLPDQTPQTGSDPVNAAGNHVVIEVGSEEYVLIAHLQPNSITVAEGDEVEAGQAIALVGNSGNTSEPHIHVHVQDQPTFSFTGIGLPMQFSDIVVNGEPVAEGAPVADQFAANS